MFTSDPTTLWPFAIFRILLVEDLVINQEITSQILEAAGHHVEVASDGMAAIEALRSGTYDIVLMDIQMPGLDGVSATRAIRALPNGGQKLPIVALTSHADPESLKRFGPAGIDGYLAKPYKAHDLHWIIEYWTSAAAVRETNVSNRILNDPLDLTVFKDLENLVGSERIKKLLQMLNLSFCEVIPLPPAGDDECAAARSKLHNLVSQAGQIGFRELSDAARRLGSAISNSNLADDDITKFEDARAAARTEIAKRVAS